MAQSFEIVGEPVKWKDLDGWLQYTAKVEGHDVPVTAIVPAQNGRATEETKAEAEKYLDRYLRNTP